MTKTKLLTIVAGLAFSCSSLALTTSVEFKNNTSSSERLISGNNVSGTITPAVPFRLEAFSSSSHLSNTPGDSVDAGVVTYSSCRFNWSTIKVGSFYTFSAGAEPKSSCRVDVLQQNAFTGQHTLKFSINN